MVLLKYSLLFTTLICWCDAYKILVVFPFPGKSHGILGDGVVKHLLAAGHQVTQITSFPKHRETNLQQVDVSESNKGFISNILNLERFISQDIDFGESYARQMVKPLMDNIFQNQHMKEFLDDRNQQFDVVIAEWMFSELYSGFAAVFNCPLIWFFPFENPAAALKLVDEYPNPAYTPGQKLSRSLPYTFTQRLTSLWTHAKTEFLWNLNFKDDEILYEKYFKQVAAKKGRALPDFEETIRNASLAFVNSHISFGLSLRTPPNYINVGGYHIDPEVKPLTEDLKKILDNAKDGVIYFSMGSHVESRTMPEQLKKNLLKTFGSLKQTVIWKFEELLSDLPKNVHILKWAPQPSILAHPNCILFITHGGLLSTTETVHFGVPAIGIPVFGDQFQNVDEASRKGYLRRVDLSHSLAEDLKVAIDDVLKDPTYSIKAKELSAIYHDRPVQPRHELVHWVEHVVRTRGATHLRSPALRVRWYQKMYLDLGALVIAIVLFIAYIVKRMCNCSKKNVNKEKKTK